MSQGEYLNTHSVEHVCNCQGVPARWKIFSQWHKPLKPEIQVCQTASLATSLMGNSSAHWMERDACLNLFNVGPIWTLSRQDLNQNSGNLQLHLRYVSFGGLTTSNWPRCQEGEEIMVVCCQMPKSKLSHCHQRTGWILGQPPKGCPKSRLTCRPWSMQGHASKKKWMHLQPSASLWEITFLQDKTSMTRHGHALQARCSFFREHRC